MAKHKQSTFERLRNGKLQWNRKERRELEHRFPSWKQTGAGSEVSQGRAFAARRPQGRSEAQSLDLSPALRTLRRKKWGTKAYAAFPFPSRFPCAFFPACACNRSLARASLPASACSISSCIRSRLSGSPLASPDCRLSRMVRRAITSPSRISSVELAGLGFSCPSSLSRHHSLTVTPRSAAWLPAARIPGRSPWC